MEKDNNQLVNEAINLLRNLVSLSSFSGEEQFRADFLVKYFLEQGITVERFENNIIVKQPHFDASKPTFMLNSHIDTVHPAKGYTFDPFNPPASDDYVYGLGSNDAGASVVCLLQTFLYFYRQVLPYNLLLVLSAEEENSGVNGIRKLTNELAFVDFAIVGEPTGMRAAIAERGLLVIDGEAKGKSGHAARNEGINAIYIALEDIKTLQSVKFNKLSSTMGEVKLTVTQINGGMQHNVVPDTCTFVVDIRPTDCYNNSEIMEELQTLTKSILTARSLTNKSSGTPHDHILMSCLSKLQIETYVSPTTSDWMRLNCPAIKMGPGESERSHQSDEFVLTKELQQGVEGYINFINQLTKLYKE
ncbi:MAG: M20/M25/M40 family metallo-hydrolase [Candidatus Saccharimonadaceae bacterium]